MTMRRVPPQWKRCLVYPSQDAGQEVDRRRPLIRLGELRRLLRRSGLKPDMELAKIEAPPPARCLSAFDWDEFVAGHRAGLIEWCGFLALRLALLPPLAVRAVTLRPILILPRPTNGPSWCSCKNL